MVCEIKPAKNYIGFRQKALASFFFVHLTTNSKKHPIGYWFAVALGITALTAPMLIYAMYTKSPTVGIAGIAGTFIVGIGLFNFVAIILNQYLGHIVSIISFFLGALLIAIDIGLL